MIQLLVKHITPIHIIINGSALVSEDASLIIWLLHRLRCILFAQFHHNILIPTILRNRYTLPFPHQEMITHLQAYWQNSHTLYPPMNPLVVDTITSATTHPYVLRVKERAQYRTKQQCFLDMLTGLRPPLSCEKMGTLHFWREGVLWSTVHVAM